MKIQIEKPTVTQRWVNVQAAELMNNINEYGGKTGVLHILRAVLPEILKLAGVEVIK